MILLELLLDLVVGLVTPERDSARPHGTAYWIGIVLLIAALAVALYCFTRQG